MRLNELFENMMNPGNDLSREIQTHLMQIKANGASKAPISSITQYLNQQTNMDITDSQTQALLGNLPMVTGMEENMVLIGDDFGSQETESNNEELSDDEEKDVVSDMASKA